MSTHVYGLGGLILLILDLWAIVSTVNSSRSVTAKLLWVLGVLVFPVVGFILWLLMGPRSAEPINRI